MTNEFRKRLEREIRLYLREMRDGCVDCIGGKYGGYCFEHHKKALELAFNPRKYLDLKAEAKK